MKPPKWWTQELQTRVRAYLTAYPQAGWRRLARDLHIPHWQAKRIFEGLAMGLDRPISSPAKAKGAGAQGGGGEPPPFRMEGDGNSLAVSGVAPHQDLEAFLRENGVDLRTWYVERYLINRWEMGARVGEELETRPLYQIKVWLRRRSGASPEEIHALLAELSARAPSLPPPASPSPQEALMAVLATPDIHVGKLAWAEETGENYDVGIALEVWRKAVSVLLAHAERYPLEQLVIPLGNDLFQVDTHNNTTTKGIPVDADGRWQKAYRAVVEFVVEEVLERARRVAPRVRLLMIPGNHDSQRVFYLGEALRLYYRDTNVHVDNRPSPRKYLLWRRVLLGFTHGHRERAQNLALLMATEVPPLWAQAQWREWQIGHYHARRQYWHMPLVDERGVVVRVLPSLSAVDAWHAEMGFVGSHKGATLIVYSPNGEVAQHLYRPEAREYVRH